MSCRHVTGRRKKKQFREHAFARIELGIDKDEWDNLHPQECESILEAWEQRQKRERIRDASMQHIIALAGGMKKRGGGQLRLEDFAPELKDKTPEEREAKLKAQFKAMAEASKRKQQNVKK
jgi:hypothetical protein